MPLDGHSYLVSQGWGGKGKGLRDGAISRPIAVTQKKNLAGLGKDRDEAFPFWDHLFTAAASAIKVHVDDSDDEGSVSESSGDQGETKKSRSTTIAFKRTGTGILSTRRPVHGISAHDDSSGTSTPSSSSSDPSSSYGGVKYSLLTVAKRDAARRGLYSRFFRGPVLGPDAGLEKQVRESSPKPQYGVEEGEETTVRAMMVRQLENAKKEGKQRSKEKEKKDKAKENEEDFKRRKEDKTERKRAKEENRAEKRKEKKVGREAKEARPAPEVEEGKEKKEKKSSKGKDKASEVSEFTPISTSSEDKKSSSKDRKRSSKKGREDTDSDKHSDRKGSKKFKRKLDGEDEDGAPKKKKKRKSDESEFFVQ